MLTLSYVPHCPLALLGFIPRPELIKEEGDKLTKVIETCEFGEHIAGFVSISLSMANVVVRRERTQ